MREKGPCCVTGLHIPPWILGRMIENCGGKKEISKNRWFSWCYGMHANSVFQGWKEQGNLSLNQGHFFIVQTMQIRVFGPHWWQTGRQGGIREALVGAIVWLLVKVTPHQFCAYFWHRLSMLNALISHILCLRNMSNLVAWLLRFIWAIIVQRTPQLFFFHSAL